MLREEIVECADAWFEISPEDPVTYRSSLKSSILLSSCSLRGKKAKRWKRKRLKDVSLRLSRVLQAKYEPKKLACSKRCAQVILKEVLPMHRPSGRLQPVHFSRIYLDVIVGTQLDTTTPWFDNRTDHEGIGPSRVWVGILNVLSTSLIAVTS